MNVPQAAVMPSSMAQLLRDDASPRMLKLVASRSQIMPLQLKSCRHIPMHDVTLYTKARRGQRNISVEHNVAQSQLFTAHDSKGVKLGLVKRGGGGMCNPHGVLPRTTAVPVTSIFGEQCGCDHHNFVCLMHIILHFYKEKAYNTGALMEWRQRGCS